MVRGRFDVRHKQYEFLPLSRSVLKKLNAFLCISAQYVYTVPVPSAERFGVATRLVVLREVVPVPKAQVHVAGAVREVP